ncbi:hypothetical protein AB6813_03120 [bacterium RCC_150]
MLDAANSRFRPTGIAAAAVEALLLKKRIGRGSFFTDGGDGRVNADEDEDDPGNGELDPYGRDGCIKDRGTALIRCDSSGKRRASVHCLCLDSSAGSGHVREC